MVRIRERRGVGTERTTCTGPHDVPNVIPRVQGRCPPPTRMPGRDQKPGTDSLDILTFSPPSNPHILESLHPPSDWYRLRTASDRMGAKILAIEDDPQILDLYVTFFERRGYTVLTCSNAKKAIATLEDNRDVKLILLDLNLPGMSGEEWMDWYEPSGIAAPVIVVSGKGDILSVARNHDHVAALTKPFHMEELQELVEVLLQGDDWQSEVTDDAQMH